MRIRNKTSTTGSDVTSTKVRPIEKTWSAYILTMTRVQERQQDQIYYILVFVACLGAPVQT